MGNLTYPPQTYFIGTENKPIVLTFSKINQVFQKYVGQSNSLDLDSFNKCLNELTHFGTLPLLAYTYLSQRCFEMITNYNTIPLTCDRFAMALLTGLSCNDTRSLILFNAIKQNQGQNFVTFLDILNFLLMIMQVKLSFPPFRYLSPFKLITVLLGIVKLSSQV